MEHFGLTGLLALAACVAACGTQPPDRLSGNAPVTLSVCLSSTGAGSFPVVFARHHGLFSKYGLDVELTSIDSGSRAAAALISGSAQICQVAAAPVLNAVIAGADLALVGGLINVNPYLLMVPATIRSAEDLKGKAVAV